MMRVMFVCHGNICRSPMGEFILRDMVEKRGLGERFEICSAGTSAEELGNPVHHGTRTKLAQYGISVAGKYACQLKAFDYDKYNYFLGMDKRNVEQMKRIFSGDRLKKIHFLLDFAGRRNEEIADPWYTGNFDVTYDDIYSGCAALLDYICERGEV